MGLINVQTMAVLSRHVPVLLYAAWCSGSCCTCRVRIARCKAPRLDLTRTALCLETGSLRLLVVLDVCMLGVHHCPLVMLHSVARCWSIVSLCSVVHICMPDPSQCCWSGVQATDKKRKSTQAVNNKWSLEPCNPSSLLCAKPDRLMDVVESNEGSHEPESAYLRQYLERVHLLHCKLFFGCGSILDFIP